jgi:hypothetical protein
MQVELPWEHNPTKKRNTQGSSNPKSYTHHKTYMDHIEDNTRGDDARKNGKDNNENSQENVSPGVQFVATSSGKKRSSSGRKRRSKHQSVAVSPVQFKNDFWGMSQGGPFGLFAPKQKLWFF